VFALKNQQKIRQRFWESFEVVQDLEHIDLQWGQGSNHFLNLIFTP
jgi:hypothetical protein